MPPIPLSLPSPPPSLFPPYPISLSSPSLSALSPPPLFPLSLSPHHRVSLSVSVVSTSASTGVPFPTDSKRVFPNSTSSSTCFSSALSLAFSSWGERRERGRRRGERGGEIEGREGEEREHSIQLHVHVIYGVVGFFTLYSLLLLSFFLYLKSVPIYVIVYLELTVTAFRYLSVSTTSLP